MNQDIAFNITPAKARLLLKVSELCLTEIDPAIVEMSQQDLVGIEGSAIEKSLAQFIKDTDFRCGICSLGHDFTREDILRILGSLGHEKIVVTGQNRDLWPRANFVPIKKFMDRDFTNRKKVILFDWGTDENEDNLEIVAKEFPKTIAYVSKRDADCSRDRTFMACYSGAKDRTLAYIDYHKTNCKVHYSIPDTSFPWYEIGCALFPNMPRTIFLQSKRNLRRVLYRPVWKKNNVNDIAILYNVFLPENWKIGDLNDDNNNGDTETHS